MIGEIFYEGGFFQKFVLWEIRSLRDLIFKTFVLQEIHSSRDSFFKRFIFQEIHFSRDSFFKRLILQEIHSTRGSSREIRSTRGSSKDSFFERFFDRFFDRFFKRFFARFFERLYPLRYSWEKDLLRVSWDPSRDSLWDYMDEVEVRFFERFLFFYFHGMNVGGRAGAYKWKCVL